MHLAIWLNCSMAGAMVLAGTALFILAWIFSPTQGLLWRKGARKPRPSRSGRARRSRAEQRLVFTAASAAAGAGALF
jgi:hypothetical protein